MPTSPKLAAHVEAHALTAAVFAGGCLGTVARAGLAQAFPPGNGVPWGTLIANVVGTALLAWFATRLQERLPPSTYRRPLLGTGVCGALTTFSTLQVELLRLGRDGNADLAVAYFVVSLAAGLIAMFTVTRLVRRARLR